MRRLSKKQNNSGFTIVELLLILAIVAIMSAATTPFMSRIVSQNNMDVTVDNIISSLRKAQSYSVNGRDGSSWGVCIYNSSVIRMFSGTCGSPTHSEDFSIPSSIDVTGFSEVTFSKLRGDASSTQTITITSPLETMTIDINAVGVLDIN
jgi:Tfp pilus assembly protein FimT